MKPKKDDPNHTVMAAIDKLAPPERVIRSLAGALEADVINRDGSRGADHKTRVAAAQLLLAYRVGRPVERQQVLTASVDNQQGEGLRDKLGLSPALRDALRRMLSEVENAPAKSHDS